jgi:redox-sensitive bicupin YhaK (pirin superfamily)
MTRTPSPDRAAELVLRPGRDRFHSRLDWLDSRHSFSFAEHHDPAWMGFGPLRVINEDVVAAGRGFGLHPHHDMEIVTVTVAGAISHRDSLGHRELLRAGEVQRMSAGTGIIHSEWNEGAEPCRLLQIWIEPERRGLAPDYEQKPFSIGPDWTLLVDPTGASGALRIARPARVWRAQPGPHQALPLPLDAGARGWLQLIEGTVTLSPATAEATGPNLTAGDGLGFVAGQLRELRAGPEGADLLLFELDG